MSEEDYKKVREAQDLLLKDCTKAKEVVEDLSRSSSVEEFQAILNTLLFYTDRMEECVKVVSEQPTSEPHARQPYAVETVLL